MSKNVKRIISALLTAGMLLGSCGMGAFAEETATDTTAAATDTAVTATAAPTTAPSGFDADAYYNEAAGLVTKMGIFEGYEDGTLKPESTITRAEMAAVILRVMDMDATSAYADTFTDVTSAHWAASVIQTAYNAGIINGMGDGTFAPDSPVTYEQAVKMIVCAIGYGQMANNFGGYPTGYINVAARKGIEVTKNVTGQVGDEAARGTVIKMIYNAISALYPTGSKVTNDGIEYTTDDDVTVGSKLHNVKSEEGIVTATYSTSIDPTSDNLGEKQVKIDDLLYNRGDVDMEQYIGYKIKVYYTEYNDDGDRTIIYIVPNKKNDTLVIDADDIESITNIRTDNAKIEYTYNKTSSKTKTAKLESPTIVYNGKLLKASDLDSGVEMEDFIKPDVGDITLNDYDGDGTYDVIFVNSFETYVVTSSTDKAIVGKYNTPSRLDLDTEDGTKLVTITKGDKNIVSKNVQKWDVATVQRSANKKGDVVINIDICNDTIEGKITDVDVDDDDYAVTIGGKEYDVDKNLFATGDVKVGKEGKFYLDKFGRIAGMDSSTGGKLSGNEQYAWLVKVNYSEDESATTVKLFTQGGKLETYQMADTVSFWGQEASDKETTLSFKDDKEDGDYTVLKNADDEANKATSFQNKLVKYELNSSGKIKTLYMAVRTKKYKDMDDDRVVMYDFNFNGKSGSGNMIYNLFYLPETMIQFDVPSADALDTATYKVSTANASSYINREGVSEDFYFAEFDSDKPGVVIKYVNSASAPSDFTYNTADDNGLFMISKIQTVYDEVNDDTVYKITGYANGNKVEYTTTDTTSIAQATGISGGASTVGEDKDTKKLVYQDGGDNRSYKTEPLWTAASKKDDILPDYQTKYTKLTDALHVGDIVGCSVSGAKVNTIIKMVDTTAYLADKSGNPWGAYTEFSNSRDGIAFGEVVSADIDETTMIELSTGDTFAIDPGYYVSVYNVKSKDVDDDVTVSELIPYDEDSKTGDLLLIRQHRWASREIFVIRFE